MPVDVTRVAPDGIVLCEKRKRILAATGPILVTGGPGSGKTTIALAKARDAIRAGMRPGQAVLFLSFSRAAVARAQEASKTELPPEQRAQLSIQTFHSFFWEMLRGYGYLLDAPKRLSILATHEEKARRNACVDAQRDWLAERESLFHADGVAAFDLFAPKALALLRGSTRLRELVSSRFPLIIVDEAQDTGEDQWNCIKLLSDRSQVMCLADLDQQIYDFRPEVSPERVKEILAALNPLVEDFRGENRRSPGTEITAFARDIFNCAPRASGYAGVSYCKFAPKKEHRDKAIRQAVGLASKAAGVAKGSRIDSLAILTPRNRGVMTISRALTGDGGKKRIPHRVEIDEADVLHASRLIAFLLEPRRDADSALADVADALDLAANVYRARGKRTNLDVAARLATSAMECRANTKPRANSNAARLTVLLERTRSHKYTGDPRRDWSDMQAMLAAAGAATFAEIAGRTESLMNFQRGGRIAAALTDLWQDGRHYRGAREVLDQVLAEDQLLSGLSDLRGVHVMTIHKAKGKEFDAVVILDDSMGSPLVRDDEVAPHAKSRKLLFVALTRAKHHVLMLCDASKPTPLLAGHQLRSGFDAGKSSRESDVPVH